MPQRIFVPFFQGIGQGKGHISLSVPLQLQRKLSALVEVHVFGVWGMWGKGREELNGRHFGVGG